MKSNWQTKTLGEMCEIISGTTPSTSEERFWNGNLPWITPAEIAEDGVYLCSSRRCISKAGADSCSLRLMPEGTVILTSRAPIGKVAISKIECYCNQGFKNLVCSKSIFNKYLFYFLKGNIEELNALGKGTTFKEISKKAVACIPIPLPPLEEQKRIVGILDAAFEKIDAVKRNAEQNLANAKELFQRVLDEEMTPKEGWRNVLLSEVCTDFGRGRSRHRPRNDKSLYGGQYPFVQTGDIRNANHIVTQYTQTYNQKGLEQSKLWPRGTLCITIAANIAETAILGFDACFPDSVIGCVVDEKQISVEFLEFLLQYFKQSLKKAGKGSAQDNINLGTFETQYFPIPLSVIEQKKIVNKLNDILRVCNRAEVCFSTVSERCIELKQQILAKAFNGEL